MAPQLPYGWLIRIQDGDDMHLPGEQNQSGKNHIWTYLWGVMYPLGSIMSVDTKQSPSAWWENVFPSLHSHLFKEYSSLLSSFCDPRHYSGWQVNMLPTTIRDKRYVIKHQSLHWLNVLEMDVCRLLGKEWPVGRHVLRWMWNYLCLKYIKAPLFMCMCVNVLAMSWCEDSTPPPVISAP